VKARIDPAQPPFPPEIEAILEKTMPPGVPPLVLFTTLARDPRLFSKFAAGNLLDRGHLTLRQREIVIDRTTAKCGSEYEWGVHVAFFGARVRLDEAQLHAIVHEGPESPCWRADERALIAACDALLENCDLDDVRWNELREHFAEDAIIEILMLAGFYRTVSYLTNALRLPMEPAAARFPEQ
jgi:alkylhydroperoxidase family enzyme